MQPYIRLPCSIILAINQGCANRFLGHGTQCPPECLWESNTGGQVLDTPFRAT